MYCVIQEIERAKADNSGNPKSIETYTHDDDGILYHGYMYSDDRFDRPIKKAYKISIQKSYRVDGVVKKKAYTLGTFGYYDMIKNWTWDYILSDDLRELADKLDVEYDYLYKLVSDKFIPIRARIKKEFQQTDEYISHSKNKEIVSLHKNEKKKFADKWHCNESEYNYCYDLYGNLVNADYLEQVKLNKAKKEKEAEQRQEWNKWFSGATTTNSYSEDEQALLKKFYRSLSHKYHPDANLNEDTTKEMKLLNKLKGEWKV